MTRLALALTMLLSLTLAAPPAGAAQICGTRRHHPARYAHVIWIWLENHGDEVIVGAPAAPYINGLASACGMATNFHNITHLSLPNYLGATSGLPLAQLQPFLLDCNPGGACLVSGASLFSQVRSWKAYQESMPTNCATTGTSLYGVRHNPPVYFPDLAGCDSFDVPYTQLQADLDADTLPAFSFVTPNLCNDMHDCSIETGDAWLQQEVPKILASTAYQRGKTVVFVTFDEGEIRAGFSLGEDCAGNTSEESCHIPAIVISPYTRPGTTSDRLFNHYSLLRTTEELLLRVPRARKYLGLARSARSMRRAFRL